MRGSISPGDRQGDTMCVEWNGSRGVGRALLREADAALCGSGTSGQYTIPQNPSATLPCCVFVFFCLLA